MSSCKGLFFDCVSLSGIAAVKRCHARWDWNCELSARLTCALDCAYGLRRRGHVASLFCPFRITRPIHVIWLSE